MSKKLLSQSCPCCGLPMQTAAMSCVSCEVKIEGNFSTSVFDKLNTEDQKFLEEYLLAGFSIKTMEETGTMGYAAIRSRLDKLIANFKELRQLNAQKKAILENLRTGKITVAEAKKKLEKL